VEPLIGALNDKDANARACAAQALGRIKDPCAVKPLIAVLKDKDKSVREEAFSAVRKITGVDFGQDQEQWQKWWEENKDRFPGKPQPEP
jgi:hypothetical protein